MKRGKLGLPILIVAVFGIAIGGWWWANHRGPDVYLQQGEEALERGDFQLLEKIVQNLESSGHGDQAYFLRGKANMALGDFPGALDQFNQLTTTTGHLYLETLALRGRCYLRMRDLKKAEQVYTYLQKEDPDNLDAQRGLAAVYFDEGLLYKAIEHCQKWAKLVPSDGKAHRFLGAIYHDLSDYDKAIKAYTQALQAELGQHVQEEVCLELADCYLKSNQYAKAEEILTETEPAPALKAEWLASEAEALYGMGKKSAAEEKLKILGTTSSVPVRAVRLHSRFLLETGKAGEAVVLLQQAIKIKPEDVATRNLLALAYSAAGEKDKAKAENREVEKLQKAMTELTTLTRETARRPNDPALHRRMADLYEQIYMPRMAERSRRFADSLQAVPAGNVLNKDKNSR